MRDRNSSAPGAAITMSGTMATDLMSARRFRAKMATIERPTTVVRLVDGEYVKLGLWIPAGKMEGRDG